MSEKARPAWVQTTIITVASMLLAFVVAAVIMVVSDAEVAAKWAYFFSRPGDALGASWDKIATTFYAMWYGSMGNWVNITNTTAEATPLIAAGLAVAIAFRAGLFNIGAQGQAMVGALAAAFVGFTVKGLPIFLHLPLVILVGLITGAIWGGIVGVLKARTGAHEVILTIMLNYVAFYLLLWMLRTPGLLQAAGSNQPQTRPTPASAQFPDLLGPQFPNLDWGFVIVIAATVFVWWLIERSSLGLRLRALGENPHAARAAGMSVDRLYIYAMLFAGGLAGLAAMNQIQGNVTTGFGATIDAGIGFDAITVALLGRSRAWGTFAAGILFGALKAGSFSMQAQGIPVDIVLVVQSLIVLFIAAPPLLRAVFFLPKTDAEKAAAARAKAAKKAVAA